MDECGEVGHRHTVPEVTKVLVQVVNRDRTAMAHGSEALQGSGERTTAECAEGRRRRPRTPRANKVAADLGEGVSTRGGPEPVTRAWPRPTPRLRLVQRA